MNEKKISRYKDWMIAKNMSAESVKSYIFFMEKFSEYINQDTCRATREQMQQFIFDIPKDYSHSYRNQAISSIKLYFSVIENRTINDIVLPRPIKDKYIPEIITEQQIKKAIFNTKNLKHLFLLFCLYDNGLRRSELLNLKLEDIKTKDLNENEKATITIRKTKCHKGRIIPAEEKFIELYKLYYKKYKPLIYLFEGCSGVQYSPSSLRNVLNDALEREGLKHIRIHDIRHTILTHSLARGTDHLKLAAWAGHTVKTLESTYSHLMPHNLIIQKQNYD